MQLIDRAKQLGAIAEEEEEENDGEQTTGKTNTINKQNILTEADATNYHAPFGLLSVSFSIFFFLCI